MKSILLIAALSCFSLATHAGELKPKSTASVEVVRSIIAAPVTAVGCQSNIDCNGGYCSSAGQCMNAPNGTPCTYNDECTSGYCGAGGFCL